MIACPSRPTPKSPPAALWQRARDSTVVWSWIFNALRLAAGFILLPLVLNKLPTAELGMYYVLLSLAALVPLVDFGLSPTIGRFVSYAVGGAESIQAHGVPKPSNSTTPNYRLLWELLFTTRALYGYVALALFLVLGAWGTYIVELRIQETTSPLLARLAWAATFLTALFDIYSSWWVTYLRSMDQVLVATRIAVQAAAVKLVIAAVLLLVGGGLLSLPVGSLFGSLLQRRLARRRCLHLLEAHPAPAGADVRKYLRILWPNTWRLGVQLLSGYLTVNANTAICLHVLGLAANARYGLSVQLVAFMSGMAAVWTTVKWPLIGQYQARHDLVAIQRLLRPRAWLQTLTYVAAGGAALLTGPWLLEHFGGGKEMLPLGWFALLLLNGFFELHFNLWGTLLSLENRLPYLWPAVATNVLSLLLSLAFIRFTSLGLGALVLGPFVAGMLFNHWYWPPFAARRLGTSLFRLLFLKEPGRSPACPGTRGL